MKVATTPQGYTPEQMQLALEYVALKSDTIRVLLLRSDTCTDKYLAGHMVSAAEALVEVVGAVSDVASGFSLRGGFENWLHGFTPGVGAPDAGGAP